MKIMKRNENCMKKKTARISAYLKEGFFKTTGQKENLIIIFLQIIIILKKC